MEIEGCGLRVGEGEWIMLWGSQSSSADWECHLMCQIVMLLNPMLWIFYQNLWWAWLTDSLTFFLQIHHKQAPPLESHIWSQRIRHANGGRQAQAFSGPFTHHEPPELWGEGDPPVWLDVGTEENLWGACNWVHSSSSGSSCEDAPGLQYQFHSITSMIETNWQAAQIDHWATTILLHSSSRHRLQTDTCTNNHSKLLTRKKC